MSIKILVQNRKASHNYQLFTKYEAGMQLQGTEVKSLRTGKGNLNDSWVQIEKGEVFLMDAHISPYEQGNRFNHEPKRTRKLLLHNREIARLQKDVHEKGYTLIPTKIYFKNRFIKTEFALAKGKKLHDKRESKKQAEAARDIDRAMKRN